LCAVRRKRVFSPGEVVFHADDEGGCFYRVATGLVDVVVKGKGKKGRRLVTIRSGMSFGELAMVTGRPRSAEACAVVEPTPRPGSLLSGRRSLPHVLMWCVVAWPTGTRQTR
jgi:CRP-like cAMP-binding protein